MPVLESSIRRIVLAYSGGLDTSAAIPYLRETYACDVVAFVGDVGQGEEELAGVEDRARASGACDCVVIDLREDLLDCFAFPALLAGPIYESKYLLGTAIARPLLAKAQVQVARDMGADALAHGCTGKGNDQVRFESAFAALAPDLRVLAPWRLWSMRSRSDLVAYLRKHNITTSAATTKTYSRDASLLHISHEGGGVESPANIPPDDVWMRTRNVDEAPVQPATVRIGFTAGRPTSLDGEALSPVALVERLNTVAGEHSVGRVDLVESRLVGMKSRGCYEAPGCTALVEALGALERLTLDRDALHEKQRCALRFAELVYDGKWFTPLREALSAFAENLAHRLTGEVTVRLHKGVASAVAATSSFSVHDAALATFENDDIYDQKHA